MSLGSRIKDARKEARLSQDALASRFGITQGAIVQWEQDKTSPKLEIIPHLAKELCVSLDWLLGADSNPIASQVKCNGMALIRQLSSALELEKISNDQIRIMTDILTQFLTQERGTVDIES